MHPSLWNAEKRLSFLLEFSGRLEQVRCLLVLVLVFCAMVWHAVRILAVLSCFLAGVPRRGLQTLGVGIFLLLT